MLCVNAAMEVVLNVTKTTAIRFQMQAAINANRSLPFQTPPEAVHLRGAYNLGVPGGTSPNSSTPPWRRGCRCWLPPLGSGSMRKG